MRDSGISAAGNKAPKKNKKPPGRKDTKAPVTDVQSGGGYDTSHAAPPPKPSWGGPLTNTFPTVPSTVAREAARKRVAARVRRAAEKDRRKQERDAVRGRAQQVHGAARRDVLASLGVAPPRVVPSGWNYEQLQIGPSPYRFRDSGAANLQTDSTSNPVPQYRGTVLSPQQIQQDIARVLAPGQSRLKANAIERLQAAGVVDPYGTTTRRQGLETAQQAFLNRYRELEQFDYGLMGKGSLSDEEILQQIGGRTRPELLEAIRSYQPSAIQQQASQTQTAGLSGDLLGAVVGSLKTGLTAAGEGIKSAYGNNIASNAAADALFLPIGAVGAAAMVADDPKAALEAIKNGAIGTAIQGGDWQKVARDHPLFSALEVMGAASAVGRTTGAIGRTASGGRVFSTKRAPLALADLPGTQLYDRRSYSKDVTRQAVQRLFDRALPDGPMVRVNGQLVPSKTTTRAHSNWRQRKMADFVASRANSRERVNREEVLREALRAAPVRSHKGGRVGQAVGAAIDRTLPSAPRYGEGSVHFLAGRLPKRLFRGERDVVSMVLEGVIRSEKTFVHDLRKERNRLETEYQRHRQAVKDGDTQNVLDRADVVANRQRAAAVDRVLDDPKAMLNAKGVFDSARKLAPMLGRLEQEAIARGALSPEKALRAKLFPAAQAHLGAREIDGVLRLPDGSELPNHVIRRAVAQAGGDPNLLTHLPHTMRLRGPAAFHQHFGQNRRNYEGTGPRTGVMFERGASPFDYQHIAETLVGRSNVLGNIREFDHMLQTVGVRHGDGRYLTADEAHRWLKQNRDDDGNAIPDAVELVPMRAFNSRVDDKQMQRIEGEQRIGGTDPARLIEQHFRDRMVLPGDKDKARNVVLVPRVIQQRIQQHIGASGPISAPFQGAQGLFRRAVLPLSAKWLFGNLAEAVLRSTIAGVAPVRDNMLGRKVIRSMIEQDFRSGKAFEAEMLGGLFIGNRGLSNKRGPNVKNIPLINEIVTTVRVATDAGFALNRLLEREAQFAVLGKATRRELQEMTGSWLKAMRAQKKAVDDLARGLRETPAQIQFARYMDETLGQYSRFSPRVRGVIQSLAPFLPWYANSVRFVMWTLPVKHSFKTALLARVEDQFQEDYDAQHNDKLTRHGELATAVATDDGGWKPLARYTPFGFLGPVAAGDNSAIAGLVLPQISGPLLAMRGLDPFGEEMTIPKKYGGTGERIEGGQALLVALNQLLESHVPGVAMTRRLREGGETALPTSMLFRERTKPGSSHDQSALERVFDPLRTIYLRGEQKTASGDPLDELMNQLDDIDPSAEDPLDKLLSQL